MFRQAVIAWPTPVEGSKIKAISFEQLRLFCHLMPSGPDEIAITDLSEIFDQEQPTSVTKHAAAQHVNNFREEGILKLGTFREYRQSDNPANQDLTEGQTMVWIEQSDYTYSDVGYASDKFKIFCTSLKYGKTEETSGYGDSRFTIEDLSGFMNAVSQDTGMVPIAMSSCLYKNSRVLQVVDTKTKGVPNPLEGPTKIQTYAHIGLSFIKPHTHLEHAEFRFLWHDPYNRVSSDGIIKCPSARNFCSFT